MVIILWCIVCCSIQHQCSIQHHVHGACKKKKTNTHVPNCPGGCGCPFFFFFFFNWPEGRRLWLSIFFFFWLCKTPRIFRFLVLPRFWSGDFFFLPVLLSITVRHRKWNRKYFFRAYQKPDQDPKNQQNNFFILKISALPPEGPPGGGGFAN